MAIYSIGSAPGRDFPTVAAFIANTSNSTTEIGEVYNDQVYSEFFALGVRGLRAAPGHSHNGVVGAGVKFVAPSAGNWSTGGGAGTLIQGIEFDCNGYNAYVSANGLFSYPSGLLDRCIIHGSTAIAGVYSTSNTYTAVIRCIVFNCSRGIYYTDGGGRNLNVNLNTVVGCTNEGIWHRRRTGSANTNLCIGNGVDFRVDQVTTNYCVSSDDSADDAPGTDPSLVRINVSPDQFIDAPNHNYKLKAGSDAINLHPFATSEDIRYELYINGSSGAFDFRATDQIINDARRRRYAGGYGL